MTSLWPRNPFGLQFKIAGAFILIILPTLFATGYLTYDQTSRALKRQKQEDELVMAKNIAAQVEAVLSKARKTVEITAELPEIIKANPETRRSELTLVIKVTELLDGLILWDLKGNPLVTDLADPDTNRLFPVSALERFVRPCLTANGSVVSDVYRSETGDAAVGISVPVRANGIPVGVLTAGILLNNHSLAGVEEVRIGKSGYAYLVDGQGQVIVHPQSERLFEDIRQNPPVQQFRETKGAGVTDFVNTEGVRVVAAYAPVEGTSWGVIVRQPASESYVYVEKMFHVLVGIFFATLALSGGVGVFVAWRIGRPVANLAEGVHRVAAGDLSATVPITTRDELGDLAKSFNEMTLRLRKQIDQAAETERHLAHNEKLAAVGQLAAGIAHEIYNPLNIISGFAEYLKGHTIVTEKSRGPLEDILRETDRCRALVANLLDFSRQSPPRKSREDFGVLVEKTLELVTPRAMPLKISIGLTMASPLPPVQADRDQIKQALLNLFFNACQAMPSGGKIDVAVEKESDEFLRLTVRDTGPGFFPDHIGKLFTPFFTTKENGTGLGLALSYAIVERHGGTLRAENHPEGGALLTLRLPVLGEEKINGATV